MKVLYLRLREYSAGYIQSNEGDKRTLKPYIRDWMSEIKDKQKEKILLLLDGYDELNDKTIRIFDDIIDL